MTSTPVEIPLQPSQAMRFTITLADVLYNLRFTYDIAQAGCWILDIGDENQNVLVAGIPLVGGSVDLLAPYNYMDFGGALVLTTTQGGGEVPGFNDLGATAHLYFIPSS